ncbi:hypothetical protein [Paraburkholderia gardini]|uniref:hypothetical protein n=1 Tax=Paraburkholderia gardini TaxID=2823469 RepID=UPI001DD5F770|nr:hypothetical protein [Paraburkholderia gardini]CAG4910301.1 hypothetical protein R69919_03777 [Paraburkholderia gardini]
MFALKPALRSFPDTKVTREYAVLAQSILELLRKQSIIGHDLAVPYLPNLGERLGERREAWLADEDPLVVARRDDAK